MSFEDRLINACKKGDCKEVEATADSLGPKIDYQDNDGLTALMWASANGYLEIVEYLIREKSANPNIKNNKGKTALDLAEEKGRKEVVEFLRKIGAKHGNEIN